MSMQSERTVPLWLGNRKSEDFSRPALNKNLDAEIIIVGAGIAGLSVAYKLAVEGRQVVVVDDGDIGGGNTSRTSAHLSNVLDDSFASLRRQRGANIARIAAESHGVAIDWIERVQQEEQIDCGFKRLDGYLLLGEGDKAESLDREFTAAREAGLAVEKARAPAGLPQSPALRFPNQARFHPLDYLAGLARAFERRGGRIFGGCHVETVEDGDRVSIGAVGDIRITADKAVVATATPINDWLSLHTKLAPYRTYALAAPVEPDTVPDVLAWDTCDPYHYIRLAEQDGRTYAIVGGADHKTGQSDDEVAALEQLEVWATANVAIGMPAFRWSGQVMETLDGLGYIGRNPGDKNVYIAAGDSGMGMTHGTIAGILIPALMAGEDHRWRDAYDPARKPLGTVATFVSENLNVAKQMADYVTPSDVPSMADIAIGEGAVLRHGAGKIAAYRDDRGMLHVRSAICPHLSCIVHWNKLEKVWDCPCHGSQFDPTGRVLHGPAIHALRYVEDFEGSRNPNLDPKNP
jgi:glycine/D-amino acid oxidase-like deaminating enzyme/nitrite reductase/ring-hydroxylating ferredoxin subunit